LLRAGVDINTIRAWFDRAPDGLPDKMMVAEYRTVLPGEKALADEIARAKEVFYQTKVDERRTGR
jgi:hypothetical protein